MGGGGLRKRRLPALLACLALAAPAGFACGDDDDGGSGGQAGAEASEVRRTVERLYAALAARDGAAACGLLAPALRERIETAGRPCKREVLRATIGPEPPRDAGVGRPSVRGRSATAVVTRAEGHGAAERVLRERIALTRTRDGWLVAGVEPAG